MAGFKLSDRLLTAARCVKTARSKTGGASEPYKVADVGCDHAYLAIHLVEQGIADACIASDVREGPLKAAAEHIKEAGLEDRIKAVLSDGVKSVDMEGFDCLCILGMGGRLTRKILEDGGESIFGLKSMVLSPQSEPELVRSFVMEKGFRIDSERTVYDEGRYYTVMTVLQGREAEAYKKHELRFGRAIVKQDVNTETDRLKNLLDKDMAVKDKLSGRTSESALESLRIIETEIDELEAALAQITEVGNARS